MYRRVLCCSLLALLALGCEEKESRVDEMLSAATHDEPPPPPPPETWEEVPSIVVDTIGAAFGTRRAKNLEKPAGKRKLKEIIADVPFTDEPVVVKALKAAKTPYVVETVWQLGKGGAKSIILRTDGRDDLPEELELTPQHLVEDPPACSVVAMVTPSGDTGVWTLEGGGGSKHRKGLAGPDLSNTALSVEKYLDRCDSAYAFFSNASDRKWEHGFNIGALIEKHDEEDEIEKLVLLGKEPVAGRKVELRQ